MQTYPIATPVSTGTAIPVPGSRMLATCEHLVRDQRSVLVELPDATTTEAAVCYTDPLIDLALLRLPSSIVLDLPDAPTAVAQAGEAVASISHSMGYTSARAEGRILTTDYERGDAAFYQHTAALTGAAYSGGALLDEAGALLGMTTYLRLGDDWLSLALPIKEITTAHRLMSEQPTDATGTRCVVCGQAAFSPEMTADRCPNCQVELLLPNRTPLYEARGMALTLEGILTQLGYPPEAARRGPNRWVLREGSATIQVTYYERKGMIYGDATLCRLTSDTDRAGLYAYLLHQNAALKGVAFAVRNDFVVLSLHISDSYFEVETGLRLFKYLFEQADHYDDILVDDFGAAWHTNERTPVRTDEQAATI